MRLLIRIMHFYICTQYLILFWFMLYMNTTNAQVLKCTFNKKFWQLDSVSLPFDKVYFRAKEYTCAVCEQFIHLHTTTPWCATHVDHKVNSIPQSHFYLFYMSTRYQIQPRRAKKVEFKTSQPNDRRINSGGEENQIYPERSLNIKE